MTLDEAIKHCLEVAERNDESAEDYGLLAKYTAFTYERLTAEENVKNCEQCAADCRQLADWLTELKEAKRLLKAAVEDMYNSVNDVHCKYCSKWHTEQCQGTSHLDCYIENKFKWRYADEALKLIGGNENG